MMRTISAVLFIGLILTPVWFTVSEAVQVPGTPASPPSVQPAPVDKTDPIFQEFLKEVEKDGPILRDPFRRPNPVPNGPNSLPGQNPASPNGSPPGPMIPPGQGPAFGPGPGQGPRPGPNQYPGPNQSPGPMYDSSSPYGPPSNPMNASPEQRKEMRWQVIEQILRNAREIRSQSEILRSLGETAQADRLNQLAEDLRRAALQSAPNP